MSSTDERLARFFSQRMVPAAESLRARGVSFFPLGAEPEEESWYESVEGASRELSAFEASSAAEALRDLWGRQDLPMLSEIGVIPCRVWSGRRTDVDDSNKSATVEDLRGHFQKDADLVEEDRITVHDRLGVLLFGGPIYVDTIAEGTGAGSRAPHRVVGLRRHV